MKIVSAISQLDRAEEALVHCLSQLSLGETRAEPDLVLLHYTGYREEIDRLPLRIRRSLNPKNILGCSAMGLLGHENWLEGGRALSLTVAWLDQCDVRTFSLQTSELPDPDCPPSAWIEALGISGLEPPDCLLLWVENSTFQLDELLVGLDFAFPHTAKIGASAGARRPMATRLILDSQAFSRGMVGAAIWGLGVESQLSQGCRPVGPIWVVEQGERNLIRKLSQAGRATTALDAFQSTLEELSPGDRVHARNHTVVGFPQMDINRILRGSSPRYRMRTLVGADLKKGTLAVAAPVRIGQQLQFFVRDPWVAEQQVREFKRSGSPNFAIWVSSSERGSRFHPDFHEPALASAVIAGIPTIGLLMPGEIEGKSCTTQHRFSTQLHLFNAKF